MIGPTGFRATCDQPLCEAEMRRPTEPELLAAAEAVGWTFNRRADGQPAVRNGKDYCPVHRRGWHLLDGLTETMAARLLRLLEHPTWSPRGAGEWRSARMMHDRGLLAVTDVGGRRYELTDAGRRAALEVKGRRAEQAVAVTPATGHDAQDDSAAVVGETTGEEQ